MTVSDETIKAKLAANNGNVLRTAKDLNIPRSTLRDRIAGLDVKKAAAPTIVGTDNSIRDQLREAERKLREIERDNLTTHAIREYIFHLGQSQPTQPRWLNERSEERYTHGIPTLFLSDLHHGEVVFPEQIFHVNQFDHDISRKRIYTVADKSIMLAHSVLKDPKFPGCVLVLGGDNINGDIHEELMIGSDRRIMVQTIDIADILHQVILKLIAAYGKVFVVGVAGNHGRSTRKPLAKFYAETNFDWLVYQMIERFLSAQVQAGQVQFCTPPARDVTFKVAGRRFRLTHGDQFRGGDGIIGPLGPITRGDNKKRTMASTLPTDVEDYDTLMLGHFHQLYQNQKLIINGSTKGYDEYALANNFAYEPPQQAFFLTHHKYGINHFMPVLAEDPKKMVHDKHWVEVLK